VFSGFEYLTLMHLIRTDYIHISTHAIKFFAELFFKKATRSPFTNNLAK